MLGDIQPFALNGDQQCAVEHPGGPLLIVAGPGTGKTRTIISRMSALMAGGRVPAANILAVTFTHKAAREMQERLAVMLPPGAALPTVGTFHALCLQWLKQRDGDLPLTIVDEPGRAAAMADALRLAAADGHSIPLSVSRALDLVIQAKQQLLGPDDDLRGLTQDATHGRAVPLVYAYYQRVLDDQHLVDFEDLLFRTVHRLRRDETWLQQLRRRYTHIFVDEFQDLNHSQYALVRLLAPARGDICVIGDPDQAIYGFRGADVGLFNRFMEDYPAARLMQLGHNYRSTRTIVRAASGVIQALAPSLTGYERTCVQATMADGKTITIIETPTPRSEAVAIGKVIEQMVGGTGFHAIDFGKICGSARSRGFADFAVLVRTSDQADTIAQVLTRAGIPCQLAGKTRLKQKPPVAKLLAALRVMVDQGTYADMNFLTDLIVPGISAQTLARFKVWAQGRRLDLRQALHAAVRLPIDGLSTARQHRLATLVRFIHNLADSTRGLSVAAAMQRVAAETTLAGRIEADDLETLLGLAAAFDREIQPFLVALAARTDTDLYRPEAEKVALMTMHAAKGLEFPIVFIAGCEAGLIPHARSNDLAAAAASAEERRLFYVAMTRAREQLFLTWSRKRTRFGVIRNNRRSPFVDDIAQQLMEGTRVASKRPAHEQLSLF